MSAFVISYKGRAKQMRPVQDAAEYRKLRDSIFQKKTVRKIRVGSDDFFDGRNWLFPPIVAVFLAFFFTRLFWARKRRTLGTTSTSPIDAEIPAFIQPVSCV